MPDYSKGCIYMIKKQDDFNNDNVYIGSCCNFSRRKCEHKKVCNNPDYENHNLKVYQYIRENGGWNHFIMIKLIDYPCNDKNELKITERRYIDEYKSKLNCNIPTRTDKEYHKDNKERYKEYHKQRYKNNKEKLKEQHTQYRENNKQKIAEKCKQRYQNNKEQILKRAKQYREDNKEYQKQYQKEYQQANKDKILKNAKQYYEDNKEQILKSAKQYYEDNKDKIKQYREDNKEYQKEYREDNREKIKQYYEADKEQILKRAKQYYEANKQKLTEKVKCDKCGCEVRRDGLVKHKKTKKCINFTPESN